MALEPLVANEPVNAVAMSEKSAFTAADDIVVNGMNAALGSV
jgi:hypothetical protein